MNNFCKNCGNKLDEGADICLKCGHIVRDEKKNSSSNMSNIMGIVGFILSIICIITCYFVVGIVFGIAGLILSIIGLKKSKELNSGKGLSIAGIIISSVGIVISLIVIIFAVLFISVNKKVIDEIDFDDIEEKALEFKCKNLGSKYVLTNGEDVIGVNDEDYWYCCLKDKIETPSNCVKID